MNSLRNSLIYNHFVQLLLFSSEVGVGRVSAPQVCSHKAIIAVRIGFIM